MRKAGKSGAGGRPTDRRNGKGKPDGTGDPESVRHRTEPERNRRDGAERTDQTERGGTETARKEKRTERYNRRIRDCAVSRSVS